MTTREAIRPGQVWRSRAWQARKAKQLPAGQRLRHSKLHCADTAVASNDTGSIELQRATLRVSQPAEPAAEGDLRVATKQDSTKFTSPPLPAAPALPQHRPEQPPKHLAKPATLTQPPGLGSTASNMPQRSPPAELPAPSTPIPALVGCSLAACPHQTASVSGNSALSRELMRPQDPDHLQMESSLHQAASAIESMDRVEVGLGQESPQPATAPQTQQDRCLPAAPDHIDSSSQAKVQSAEQLPCIEVPSYASALPAARLQAGLIALPADHDAQVQVQLMQPSAEGVVAGRGGPALPSGARTQLGIRQALPKHARLPLPIARPAAASQPPATLAPAPQAPGLPAHAGSQPVLTAAASLPASQHITMAPHPAPQPAGACAPAALESATHCMPAPALACQPGNSTAQLPAACQHSMDHTSAAADAACELEAKRPAVAEQAGANAANLQRRPLKRASPEPEADDEVEVRRSCRAGTNH